MVNNIQKDSHNYGIDLYRFILIMWIVLYHYTVRYNDMELSTQIDFGFTFENGGRIGVSLFFMVSGYYMMKSLLIDDYGGKCYFHYLVKRYYRLWMPYFVSCIFIYLWLTCLPLYNRTVGVGDFMINLLLIYHPGIDCIDNAHWFIGDLFLLQVIVGIIFFVNNELKRKYILCCLYILSLLSCVLGLPILTGLSKEIFEVTYGMIIYLFLQRTEKTPQYLFLMAISLLGIIYIFTLSLSYFLWTVAFIVLQIETIKMPPPILRKTVSYLGGLSFFWYLVHQNIGYSVFFHLLPDSVTGPLWILPSVFITLIVAIIVSALSKKFGIFLNKQLKKKYKNE